MANETKQPRSIARDLLAWYDVHARELPWRVSPRDHARGVAPDPYRVWLSEIMLQQTTVATVKDYFLKFMALWPHVESLAAASEDDVLRAWAGLGYYSRARNLKKCADVITRDYNSIFPDDIAALKALPGIGDYTSAAIAAIAYNKPAAVMDGNVERVVSRLFAISTPLPVAKAEIKTKVAQLLDPARAGDFAQATMDLGATICSPKRPACNRCPINDNCQALAKSDPELFPVKAPKKTKPKRMGAAFVVMRDDGAIVLEKRPPNGLLASMAQVPTTNWNSRQDGETTDSAAPFAAQWQNCGSISHVFTHFELELTIWRMCGEPSISPDQWWSPRHQIDQEALPTVMKKAIACAIE